MNKIIVVGIILSFLFVGFQPVVSVEISYSNEIIEIEEDCNCEEIDTETFESLNRAINKVKFFTILTFVLLKNYPEFDKSIINKISNLKEQLNNFNLNSLSENPEMLCDMLLSILNSLEEIETTFQVLWEIYHSISILNFIFESIVFTLQSIEVPIFFIYKFLCLQ